MTSKQGQASKCSLCNRDAHFTMLRIYNSRWINTCRMHDNFIGIENLMLQGIPKDEAVAINREVKGISDRCHKKMTK